MARLSKAKGSKKVSGSSNSGRWKGSRFCRSPPHRPGIVSAEEIELTQALAHQVMLALQLNEFAEQGRRAAVFEERNRMARDIHDTLAQGFTGVIVQLEAAEDAIS
jgi:signal transduction histidine kinase